MGSKIILIGILICNLVFHSESASIRTSRNSTYESITDQLFQIVRGIINEQQAFERSVDSQLEDVKSTVNLLKTSLSSEQERVHQLQKTVQSLSDIRGNFKQSMGQFYPKMIILYKGTLDGQSWDVQLPTDPTVCTSIPSQAMHKISSVDTNGLCVILFKGKNCGGRGIRFYEYTYGHDDFGKISFHDQPTSYKSC